MIEESFFGKVLDPRTVSKDQDSPGRHEISRQVIESRTQHKQVDSEVSSQDQKKQKLAEVISKTYDSERQKEKELEKRTQNLIVKIKEKLGLQDKQIQAFSAEIDQISQERRQLYQEIYVIEDRLAQLAAEKADIPNPRDLIDAYYEKIANTPLNNEQKRELLQPEALAQLSMDEYIKLWKRLNPQFLSHVTRQGFRDHNGMMYHSAGLNEFHNGLLGVVEDSKILRPPMAVHSLRDRSEDSVRAWMGDWVFEGDEAQAYDRLDSLLNFHLASAPKYPDKTAVHFAAQIVADDYYGGERDNEVFFIFPSDFIASQHDFAFNGWEKDFTKPQSEQKWNDVFVWPQSVDDAGINVDAGVVFLPKSTLVDAKTGSKYASEVALDEEGKERVTMLEDSEMVARFVEWGQNLNQDSDTKKLFEEYREERHYWKKQDKEEDVRTYLTGEMKKLGCSKEQALILSRQVFQELHRRVEFNPEVLDNMIRESGAHYKHAENGIPAEEYWENHFSQNENIKPKHIVYYDGDPTSAVIEFQRENGIGMADTTKQEGPLLGFDDRHVEDMQSDPRANSGKAELESVAKAIISSHYAQA